MFKWDELSGTLVIKCHNLLELCSSNGLNMVPYSGLRTLEYQAKLWRQHRSIQEINEKISYLKEQNCDYLASILDKVGPQPGVVNEHLVVTHAIPGYSWHNWGCAVDFFVREDDRSACWNSNDARYDQFGEFVKQSGLKWGGDFNDKGHVQVDQKEIPDIYTLLEVNNHFKNRNS